jgi:hypothetical protein
VDRLLCVGSTTHAPTMAIAGGRGNPPRVEMSLRYRGG